MNSFLENIFSYQYFGVILLCVIAFLAVLFIVIFAFAIKDAKKTKVVKTIVNESDEEEAEDEDVKVKEEIPLDDIIESKKQDEDNEIKISENLESTLADLDQELSSLNIEDEENVPDIKIEFNDGAEELNEDIKELTGELEEEVQEDVNISPEQNDLQSLAMSLVKDFKKKESPKKVETIEMPKLDDIPTPQPVKVVDETPIIDSSKVRPRVKRHNSINDIVGEEYKLK